MTQEISNQCVYT